MHTEVNESKQGNWNQKVKKMKIYQYIQTKARYRVFTGIQTPSEFWASYAPSWGFGDLLSKLTMVFAFGFS